MALPVILIDSATGSDTLASGAGPSTALTGTSASTSADGLTVTLDGSPSLTNVATDGSHVIFLNDTTAGNRNFGKITAKDDVAKTVTVSNAFGLSLSGKSWAIGGKRSSLLGTLSSKLIENNSANGDAMPGWAMEMASGHSETRSSTINCRRAGDQTDGAIIVRGAAGASTLPLITFSNNGQAFIFRQINWQMKAFEIQNSNATKTLSIAFSSTADSIVIDSVRCDSQANNFWRFYVTGSSDVALSNEIIYCKIGYTAGTSVVLGSSNGAMCRLMFNDMHNGGSHAIDIQTDASGHLIYGNLIRSFTGNGVLMASFSGTAAGRYVIANTIDGCSADAIKIQGTQARSMATQVTNNLITNNTGYGINFTNATATNATSVGMLVNGNNFFNNSSGNVSVSGISTQDGSANPGYTNTASGDYSIASAAKALGVPKAVAIGTYGATYSYMDPGAAQRQEPAFIAPSGLIARNIGTY